jgi:hypothetical protein
MNTRARQAVAIALYHGFAAVFGPDGVDVIHEFGDPVDFEVFTPEGFPTAICDPL